MPKFFVFVSEEMHGKYVANAQYRTVSSGPDTSYRFCCWEDDELDHGWDLRLLLVKHSQEDYRVELLPFFQGVSNDPHPSDPDPPPTQDLDWWHAILSPEDWEDRVQETYVIDGNGPDPKERFQRDGFEEDWQFEAELHTENKGGTCTLKPVL